MQTNSTLRLRLIILIILAVLSAGFLSAQKIITVAGNSNGNGPGNSKKYNDNPQSYGVAIDDNANIFFSEINKATVTKIDADANVVLVAGNISEPGFSGDGGLATNAKLNGPRGISIDKNFNIYIADTYNNRIRKVDANGIITTIAGGGNGGDGGLAVNAKLIKPVDVILDSVGNIYISEQGNNKIRKINAGGIITTFAGNGTAAFAGDGAKAINASINQPSGICFDKKGNFIIADTYNRRIRKVNRNGIISTIGGTGSNGDYCNGGENDVPATTAAIGEPSDVDVDSAGNLFLIASYNCSVQYIDKKGFIYVAADNRDEPQSLAYNKFNNSLYYSTIYEDVCWGYIPNVVHFDLSTLNQETLLGHSTNPTSYNGDSIPATVANLSYTLGTAFINGSLYFVDANFYRVRKIDEKGIVTTFAGNGIKGSNGFGDGGLAVNAEFKSPNEISVDKDGNIYISDAADNRIRKINKQGIITTAYNVTTPKGLFFDKKRNLFVSSKGKIIKIDSTGIITTIAGTNVDGYNGDNILAKNAWLSNPVGVYVDDKNNIYIADQGNQRIRKVDTSGIITTVAGNEYGGYNGDNILAKNAWLANPTGITKDAQENFIITDNGNHRIRKVDKQGIITTIAGGGVGDPSNCDGEWFYDGEYSGDDDSAFGANLNYPYNVAFDKKGNMFISDQYNYRIREVINNCSPKPSPNTTAIKQYVNKKFTLQYNCNLLATVTPRLNYLSALNANILANVWVESKVVRDSAGKPFAPRHFQVYPERLADVSSTSTITLYINQSDFDKYNSATGNSYAKLPASPNDTNGVVNLMVYMYKSKSKDSTGLPTSYTTNLIKINPRSENIIWNDTGKYWQVTVNLNALGGIFIGTEKKIVSASGKEYVQMENDINVYPNPAGNTLFISLPNSLLYKKIILADATGKQVTLINANANVVDLNLNNLAAGIYYIKFYDGTVKKVIHTKQ